MSSAALTKEQKADLAMLSAKAKKYLDDKRVKAGEEVVFIDRSYKAFDDFRLEQVRLAVGREGLRCCTQDDYCALMAHFNNLLDEPGVALKWQMRAAGEPKRQARAVLDREIIKAREAGITFGYVAAICKNQFKCAVEDASAKQLWSLVYTVRNRAAKKKAV